jgi:medium-chain acyl-[acyl-carrier-protein] hydrolase
MLNRNWFVTPEHRPDASVRLICLPYAGGSAAAFRHWAKRLSHRIEFSVLQLPGREHRFNEPFLRSLPAVIETIGPLVAQARDKPFVLFGHSVGALMAFELTRWLRAAGAPGPLHLIVAGKRAPHVPLARSPLHELSDEHLIDKLRELNGTPQQVLETRELLDLMLPRVRADFEVNETYRYREGAPLDCPMTVFGGSVDPETSLESLAAWEMHSCGPYEQRMFPGDHFFVHSFEDQVLADIQRVALNRGNQPRMPLATAV